MFFAKNTIFFIPFFLYLILNSLCVFRSGLGFFDDDKKNECLSCALGKEIRKCEDQFRHFWTQLIKRVSKTSSSEHQNYKDVRQHHHHQQRGGGCATTRRRSLWEVRFFLVLVLWSPFFLKSRVSNLNPALCFSCWTKTAPISCVIEKRREHTHAHARRSLPLGKRAAPRIGSTTYTTTTFAFFDPSLSCCCARVFRLCDFVERRVKKSFGSLKVIIQLLY